MPGRNLTDYEQITSCIMDWIKKIFKGCTHKFSERHYHGHYAEDPQFYSPSGSGDAWQEHENEEIDHAIALSLLEESQKRRKFIDDESQEEEDEQLARATQESLNFEPPLQYENANTYQPIPVHFPMGYRICAGCDTEIGYGRFLNCLNAFWHPECFRCHACSLPISDYEFSMSGNYRFHKSCYKERYYPKCDVCNNFIPTNPAGLIEYRAHPFWTQKYCPSHEHDGTPRCCSCERMETQETGCVALNDGRKLCLECLDSAIMDTKQCHPLYQDIQEFYEGLNMKVEQQVPLLLVERQALNEAREGEKNSHYHMPETRGLCLSEEQTVSTILRRPRSGTGNQAMDMLTEPYKLARRCEVTAILILYGLPRLLTGSILAHEMMHAWMRLQGFPTLSQDVEEGICQVLAHMWLLTQLNSSSSSNVASTSSSTSSRLKKGKRPNFETKLGEFFKHQIESDTSPVYGDGFRAGHQAVYKYGLGRTLEHIRMTGKFPY
ncbi:protein DA1-like isoform X2 [Durio zibethinus]|uniref:Protein DA1-like isoform X2 n=1 Tax=Durio zibethinus TaxID=66656 RepID=A0A6P6B6I4_DURZI|nr:protein DA1-like isoform X2 [Durio zibethinus]